MMQSQLDIRDVYNQTMPNFDLNISVLEIQLEARKG